jgi:hypothetical protein
MSDASTPPVTQAQQSILRTLYDPETGHTCTSHLRPDQHASADTLVERGWLWREDDREGRRSRPTYGLNPKGIPAAQAAWQDT